ncbi:MAG TPA: tetratricopeptide repeat protein [Chitinophagales bacterium]|nr:tetratricopeptide repeat protein [Chitinophagales bacterium]HMY23882.1 tetratricopeptide repeat protein [Chitinophagales bacterium]HMZ33380.1 tetratricopeptide repeat protein [Chitinophagales bacterium]HNA38748.1 tetratricopeptide repeat protein [Chitinophagales bacterium]HNB49478.1 tetratricopeptide repeat protein [Chitinophagales bacterium]
MKKTLLLISLFISILSFAQDGNYDEFLARQFLQNGEYEKAAAYYKDLYEANPSTYYNDYLSLLIQLTDYEKAEKVIKAQYKQAENNPIYLMDLADIYLKQNKEDEAQKQFNKVIKELKADKNNIKQIAQKFIQLKQIELAQKTYLKAKELFKDNNAFNLEIASLLFLKNDIDGMIQAYLNEAALQPDNLSLIETGLQKIFTEEKNKDLLEKELLKRTQTHKRALVYLDLLIWLYMQRNDFDAAVLQAKSLDLLRNEDGGNVLRIARTAAIQQDFDAAIKGYQYVINKGPSFEWYVTANLELINVQRDKIVNSPNYTIAQLLSLKKTYQDFILNFKNEYTTTNAIIELAQLEALYIHEIDTAIQLLLPIVENNYIAKNLLAKAKLNLGDYYIIDNQAWESLLLYTQVEKSEKGNPLGEEAKYKNAKLSYYKGDFEWAQTQLKIIKANTSEFISNDAIDLSVFILDNLNTDDTDFALLLFAKADLLRFQNKLNAAEDTLNKIIAFYPSTALIDDILYMKYKIEKDRQHYEKAAAYLEEIVAQHSDDLLADNALFYLGDLYQKYLKDEEKAKTYYEKIILDFKDSTFTIEARKRYRKLRGDI